MYSLAIMAYEVIVTCTIFSIFVFLEKMLYCKRKVAMCRIVCDYDCVFFVIEEIVNLYSIYSHSTPCRIGWLVTYTHTHTHTECYLKKDYRGSFLLL